MIGEVIAQYGSTEQTVFQHTGTPVDATTMDGWDVMKRLSALSATAGTLLVLEFHLHKDSDNE